MLSGSRTGNSVAINDQFSESPIEIEQADIIILPGSKNTIADLVDIKNNGVAQAIIRAHKQNKTVIGICGGYQMMGQSVEDPMHVEGNIDYMPGLGLLPVRTTLAAEKITRQCTFNYKDKDHTCTGYEIHMGITESKRSLNKTSLGHGDGYLLKDNCWGTYIHGILDNHVVVDDLLKDFSPSITPFDYQAYKEEQYDKLAAHLREHLDMNYIYGQLNHER